MGVTVCPLCHGRHHKADRFTRYKGLLICKRCLRSERKDKPPAFHPNRCYMPDDAQDGLYVETPVLPTAEEAFARGYRYALTGRWRSTPPSYPSWWSPPAIRGRKWGICKRCGRSHSIPV